MEEKILLELKPSAKARRIVFIDNLLLAPWLAFMILIIFNLVEYVLFKRFSFTRMLYLSIPAIVIAVLLIFFYSKKENEKVRYIVTNKKIKVIEEALFKKEYTTAIEDVKRIEFAYDINQKSGSIIFYGRLSAKEFGRNLAHVTASNLDRLKGSVLSFTHLDDVDKYKKQILHIMPKGVEIE